jgi:hypothetical protein
MPIIHRRRLGRKLRRRLQLRAFLGRHVAAPARAKAAPRRRSSEFQPLQPALARVARDAQRTSGENVIGTTLRR